MKCSLDGKNAGVFAKAIQSLSRIGPDLFIEIAQNAFLLKSINTTKSAVGTFKFSKNFFDRFECSKINGEEHKIFCKISMKACLIVFKNMKQVESCQIQIENLRSRLEVKLKCRLKTVKNSLIRIIDDENVTTAVSINNLANLIVGSHKVFAEVTSNFQNLEEEITLEAMKTVLSIQNYVTGSRVNDKFMRSQLKLQPNEFETYTIEEETSVTFCLKEFRAFLLFAESLNEQIIVNFNESGSPIIFQIKKLDLIESNLTMSTLAPEDVSFYDECKRNEDVSLLLVENQKKRKIGCAKDLNYKKMKSLHDPHQIDESSQDFERFPLIKNFSDASVDAPRNFSQKGTSSSSNLTKERNMAAMSTVPNTASFLNNNTRVQTGCGAESNTELEVIFVDTEDFCKLSKPANSLRKEDRLKSIFARCFDATFIPLEPSANSNNFVADSDGEN